MANASDLSMSELVKETKSAYGLTWADMAEQLGRSDRMIRKIANGESSGESYRTSLTELYERGQVETMTPRQRNKHGELRRVRTKRGSDSKSVVPADTRGKRVGKVKRGKFSHSETNLAAGNKLHHIEMPRSARSEGRKKGLASIKGALQKITKSQARADKRVKLSITVEDDRGVRKQYQVGSKSGYHASDILSDTRTDHGGNIEGWLSRQLDAVYPDLGNQKIVAVDMNAFNAHRTKPERRQEDIARTRRHRWKR